jgi:hypothetical protein
VRRGQRGAKLQPGGRGRTARDPIAIGTNVPSSRRWDSYPGVAIEPKHFE